MSAASRRASKQKKSVSEPAMPSDLMTLKPVPATGLDMAFGPSDLSKFLPPRDQLPEPFRSGDGPWCQMAQTWFFSGLKAEDLKAKPGIDKTAALAHCATIMRSWAPKHEHKIGGVGFLLSLWFEERTR